MPVLVKLEVPTLGEARGRACVAPDGQLAVCRLGVEIALNRMRTTMTMIVAA
jgi:hypothetical protein